GVSKRNDIDTLLKIMNDLNDHELKIRSHTTDEEYREFYIEKYINYLELLSGLYNNARFEKVTKEEVKSVLIHDIAFISTCLIEFEKLLENRTDKNTFVEIVKFYKKYNSKINSHMEGYIELGLFVRKKETPNNS
nr:hypothetical protein [Alphaproteobacteria bacterium]